MNTIQKKRRVQMNSKDYMFLENTIHKNYIKFDLTEEILSHLFVTKDGTVMAVKKEYLKDIDKDKINLNLLGYKKMMILFLRRFLLKKI